MSRLLLVLLCCVALSCVTKRPLEDGPASSQSQRPSPAATPAPTPGTAREAPIPHPGGDCQALPAGIKLPYYISSASVVVIGFLKKCQTVDGQEGFQRGSSWTAMGFPCTGGRGRIDKKGDNTPSLVTFHLQNSCPMLPSRTEDVEVLVRQTLKIPVDSRLIAYYPLSVDYWEFVDSTEADVGYRPEIYTPPAITQNWQKFSTKNEPLNVRLYGRENAWEPGRKLYEVQAQLYAEGRNTFRLQVTSARVLDDAGRKAVKERCEGLRPRRDCSRAFGL
ncbi:hypothetical protein [Oligoflexus tunisiensis]|uniref:hypothetical protein n=1 Tax=Oligoflexus tunisiensis TaxID=708132 RepID=UPI00114D293A|nr:hypothetical protein [Oligoflexus tunisiensis]